MWSLQPDFEVKMVSSEDETCSSNLLQGLDPLCVPTLKLLITKFAYLGGLVVQYDQISVTYIEARQVITGIFGIKNIFIHYKCCSSCFRCISTVTKKNTDYHNMTVQNQK